MHDCSRPWYSESEEPLVDFRAHGAAACVSPGTHVMLLAFLQDATPTTRPDSYARQVKNPGYTLHTFRPPHSGSCESALSMKLEA